MKATELMIGDLVRVSKDVCFKKGTIVKVRGIDADNVFTAKGLKGSATCMAVNDPDRVTGGMWCDFLEPIPLTKEILEQNGFGRVPQPGCSNPYHWKLEQRDEDGELLYKILAYNTLFRGMFIHINNPSDCASISFCRQIKHVHELQHALRLCHINKEITIKED